MSEQTPESPVGTAARAPVATVVGVLALVAGAASLIMTLAHLDIPIPVVMEEATMLPPVAGGFALATLLCVAVAVGAFRAARWGWWLGVIVFAAAVPVVLGSPEQNWVSYLVLGAALVGLVLLVSRSGRVAYGIGR